MLRVHPPALRLLGLGRLFRFALRAGDKSRQRLEEQRKRDGGHHVRLAQPQGRQPEKVPQLAERKAGCGRDEDRHIRTSSITKKRIEELGDDQDGEDSNHQAGRHKLHQLIQKAPCARPAEAPSRTRRWVVMSELRWIPDAMAACAGTPYSNASSRCPNCAWVFSRVKARISNTRSCSARSWILMLPPAISTPLRTQSYARARTW